MEKNNQTYYIAILVEVETLFSQAILCADLPQLQMLLDTIDEKKFKISMIEVDDVKAYVELNEGDLSEKEDLDDDFPGFNLN